MAGKRVCTKAAATNLRLGNVQDDSRASLSKIPGRAAKSRRGVATVEFAVVAPLLLLLVFVVIEFGRMIMVQQILTNASREGARRAIVEAATVADVEAKVNDYLSRTSVSAATPSVSSGDLKKVGFGDPITVSVSVKYREASWLPVPRFVGDLTLTGCSVMRAERPE